MTIETAPFDVAKYLETIEGQADFLNEAFREGDHASIVQTLGVIVRARGIKVIAEGAGITQEALHEALSAEGDLKFSTFLDIVKALGFNLTVVPVDLDAEAA